MWFGPQGTLRNAASQPGTPGWDDDLTTRAGYDFPCPDPVSYTLNIQAQPVIGGGRIFLGDMEGNVYGINEFDGTTLWTASNSGGTSDAAAIVGGVVVFNSLNGYIRGYSVSTGTKLWEVKTSKHITSAPCAVGTNVYVTCHDGKVYAVDTLTGNKLWTSQYLGAPIQGGLASDGSSLYVGCENMVFYKLSCATGAVQNSVAVMGQGFRMLWPVVFNGKVWVTTVAAPRAGSEYLMEELMADSTSATNEQDNIARWLTGDTNGGRWTDASPDWKHFWVFNTSTMTEPFTVPVGYTDGCGRPTSPPAIDNQNRVLKWFKTRYPTLTSVGSFGTNYSVDISAIDQTTGRRILIDNGRLSGQGGDTDNLYWLAVGGNRIFMRNDFRGTQMIDLTDSTGKLVQVERHRRDSAVWGADIWYFEGSETTTYYEPLPDTPNTHLRARIAPSISGSCLYITEPYCLTAIEHKP